MFTELLVSIIIVREWKRIPNGIADFNFQRQERTGMSLKCATVVREQESFIRGNSKRTKEPG